MKLFFGADLMFLWPLTLTASCRLKTVPPCVLRSAFSLTDTAKWYVHSVAAKINFLCWSQFDGPPMKGLWTIMAHQLRTSAFINNIPGWPSPGIIWRFLNLFLAQISVLRSQFSSVQFVSVTQLCPTLCDPMNCSTPGLLVHHQLLEFTQTHIHRVGDAV